MSLDDVKNGDGVTASEEVLDDVSADETAAANDEVDVSGLGRHQSQLSKSRHSHFGHFP